MLANIQLALSTLIVIALAFSVYYSFRYRREADPRLRGLYSSRMNIAMGIMLVILAVTQLFFLHDSVMRRIFGTVCLLLGVFNLFAGIRNHIHFSRL
ncbi:MULTISPECIES: YtpI family protein [Paenibacillus]|uniref:YtpI family protein n=1 Tax=Paenibacillus TaxID=44249 RepID=UPI0022B9048F|nr:YtpI family protein [Paenibacillus caseinilyticus]MCZ8518354.1 YtpI family protein [Paenibacillus caseinilyticus]